MDIELFRQQIAFLKANFSVVRMEEVLASLDGQIALPENAVLLTFDDGYIDNYTYVMPALVEEGLQGSFFIPGKTFDMHSLLDVNKIHYILAAADIRRLLPDVFERMNFYRGKEYDYPSNEELFEEYAVANRFDLKETIFVKRMLQTALPERARNLISSDLFERYVGVSEEVLAYELYMSREQIRTLKRHGMYIGIHGYDHYWLGNLSRQQMQEDISKALDVMDEFIDTKGWVMNYPYGSHNKDVVEYIQQRGCRMGMTTEVRVVDWAIEDRYLLPRFDCNDFPPKSENYRG
ncbi:MAG: polysaccharide deacetylase family protein [Lachnospiraceae bacterium]|nr:polysaccharide deacetylase family protein [Lachnospiraceae bacterium]